jgi:hypothetical protein
MAVIPPALLPLFLIFLLETPGEFISMTRTEIPPAPGPPVRTAVVMCVAFKAPVIHFYGNQSAGTALGLAQGRLTNLVSVDDEELAIRCPDGCRAKAG